MNLHLTVTCTHKNFYIENRDLYLQIQLCKYSIDLILSNEQIVLKKYCKKNNISKF